MTLEDFYTTVLRKLKVVPPNGAALAEDRARVVDKYPLVHAMLLSEGLVEWSASEAIPDKFVMPLASIVAYQLVDDFSIPQEEVMRLKAEGSLFEMQASLAERQLRKLLIADYVDYTAPATYF